MGASPSAIVRDRIVTTERRTGRSRRSIWVPFAVLQHCYPKRPHHVLGAAAIRKSYRIPTRVPIASGRGSMHVSHTRLAGVSMHQGLVGLMDPSTHASVAQGGNEAPWLAADCDPETGRPVGLGCAESLAPAHRAGSPGMGHALPHRWGCVSSTGNEEPPDPHWSGGSLFQVRPCVRTRRLGSPPRSPAHGRSWASVPAGSGSGPDRSSRTRDCRTWD